LDRRGIRWTLAFACGIAGAGVLFLAFVTPPHSPWWRVAGMAVVGCGAGLLHTAMFHAISPVYRRDPGATVNLAGILFGMGCLTVAAMVSFAFYLSNAPTMQVWIAVIPAAFGWIFWKTKFTEAAEHRQPSPRAIFAQLKNPGAVLLS